MALGLSDEGQKQKDGALTWWMVEQVSSNRAVSIKSITVADYRRTLGSLANSSCRSSSSRISGS